MRESDFQHEGQLNYAPVMLGFRGGRSQKAGITIPSIGGHCKGL